MYHMGMRSKYVKIQTKDLFIRLFTVYLKVSLFKESEILFLYLISVLIEVVQGAFFLILLVNMYLGFIISDIWQRSNLVPGLYAPPGFQANTHQNQPGDANSGVRASRHGWAFTDEHSRPNLLAQEITKHKQASFLKAEPLERNGVSFKKFWKPDRANIYSFRAVKIIEDNFKIVFAWFGRRNEEKGKLYWVFRFKGNYSIFGW